jgi:hypothetical protein
MRASITRYAVFAITILALSGCRGGAGSYSPWNWGRKNAAANSNMSTPSDGPALPSASATPGNYGSTAQAPPTPGYPDQTAAAYQPPGSPGLPAGYPGQPAGYNNVAPAGTPNAAPDGYGAMPNAAQGGYGAMPNAAEVPAAVAAAPQNGLYNEGYGQAQVAPASTDQSAYQTPQGGAYQSPAAPGAQGYAPPAQGYAPPAADPYATGAQPAANNYAQPPAGNYAQPADGYAPQAQPPASAYATPDAASGGAYPPSDGQYANDRYSTDTAQPEQAAADRYAASNSEPVAQPAAEQSQAAPGGERYQSGSTGYNPGQTGYSPPGVAPYQMPGQPNTTSSPRRDPYYRPGGTSDYSTGAVTPAAATSAGERYAPPPIGSANPTERYAPPAGNYQAPGTPGAY